MPQSTGLPILAAFFEEHEFGKYLPVEEVTKRLRQDITGQGFQVKEIKITPQGTMFSWRRKGNGRWTISNSTALRAEPAGVKIPTQSRIGKKRQTPAKRRGRMPHH